MLTADSFETLTINTTVTHLASGNMPDGCKAVRLTPAAQAVRWRDDGGNPSTADGHYIAANESLYIESNSMGGLRVIGVASGAKVNITYYT